MEMIVSLVEYPAYSLGIFLFFLILHKGMASVYWRILIGSDPVHCLDEGLWNHVVDFMLDIRRGALQIIEGLGWCITVILVIEILVGYSFQDVLFSFIEFLRGVFWRHVSESQNLLYLFFGEGEVQFVNSVWNEGCLKFLLKELIQVKLAFALLACIAGVNQIQHLPRLEDAIDPAMSQRVFQYSWTFESPPEKFPAKTLLFLNTFSPNPLILPLQYSPFSTSLISKSSS